MLYDRKLDLDVIGRKMHQAADLMEQGWCQGTRILIEWADNGWSKNGIKYCAIGAIGKVLGNCADPYFLDNTNPEFLEIKRRIMKYLKPPGPREFHVWIWNDAEATTQEQVVEVFRESAYLK